MKELSTEEKAKRYDEAIKRAREKYAMFEGMKQGDALEDVFPELKESEDEKIRKAIVSGMTTLKELGKETFATININDCISWLEKQGDKDSQVKFPTFTFDDILALQCCMETVKKVQEDKDLYERLNELHGRIYDACHLEKQGEQKSTEVRTTGYWHVEDVEQNPAWSEEDEGFLDSALCHIQNSITNGVIKSFVECPLSIWLKSLRERVQPQNAWKPSDEQMDALETAVSSLQSTALESLYQKLKKL